MRSLDNAELAVVSLETTSLVQHLSLETTSLVQHLSLEATSLVQHLSVETIFVTVTTSSERLLQFKIVLGKNAVNKENELFYSTVADKLNSEFNVNGNSVLVSSRFLLATLSTK